MSLFQNHIFQVNEWGEMKEGKRGGTDEVRSGDLQADGGGGCPCWKPVVDWLACRGSASPSTGPRSPLLLALQEHTSQTAGGAERGPESDYKPHLQLGRYFMPLMAATHNVPCWQFKYPTCPICWFKKTNPFIGHIVREAVHVGCTDSRPRQTRRT